MRTIDELYLERPTRGSRTMRDALADRGLCVGRERVRRLMRLMGLVAVYPKKRISQPGKNHKIYPYLLRGLEVVSTRASLRRRYHVHPDGQGLRLSGGRH